MKMNAIQNGLVKFNYSKYGDDIIICKPILQIMNIVFGTKYLDIKGQAKALNKTNGMQLVMNFTPKGWTSDSHLEGSVQNSNGKVILKFKGEWLKHIECTFNRTGTTEVVWRRDDVGFPDESTRQFEFNNYTLKLNHLPAESEYKRDGK